MSKLTTTYLLLGSNSGDRKMMLSTAARLIGLQIGKVTALSKLYETQPWGKADQPDFLNQAVEVQTMHTPAEVLRRILAIEVEMGRLRTGPQWGPRAIDIDILLFGEAKVNQPDLVIPHPRLHERNFALIPLMELAPELVHPVLNTTIEDLYFSSPDMLDVYTVD